MVAKRRSSMQEYDYEHPPEAKRRRIVNRTETAQPPQVYTPAVKHRNHPHCQVGQNFHSVPYPLTLMPYSSWQSLHHDRSSTFAYSCPSCGKGRGDPPAHKHKLFLVAERLSWNRAATSFHERHQNETILWAVNYKLGILDPVVEDEEEQAGGKHSRMNLWHPFKSEFEMRAALRLIEKADNLSDASWYMWLGMIKRWCSFDEKSSDRSLPETGSLQRMKSSYTEVSAKATLPTPPSSTPGASQAGSEPKSSCHEQINFEFRTLQDFYSMLDMIERTSFVAAKYLEAYAEHLRDDVCSSCWFTHNILSDQPSSRSESPLAPLSPNIQRPATSSKFYSDGIKHVR